MTDATTDSVAKAWLLLAVAVVTEVTGSLSLRAAVEHPGFYVLTAAGYVAAFACLSLVLRAGMPLSVAYGVWGACGVALTAILGALVFDEPLTLLMAVGMALVIGGVVLVEAGAAHPSVERDADGAALALGARTGVDEEREADGGAGAS